MENPQRTAAHLARLAQRQSLLGEFSTEMVQASPSITLEVGCGHGHFLTAYASAHPTTTCVGLDIIAERVERALKKRQRAGLANLHFLHASVEDFLATIPAGLLLAEVFVLFPDPWPKRRHHKNRVMRPSFLDAVAASAQADARLCFRTDHTEYFAAASEVLRGHARWQITVEPWPFEHETVFQQRAPAYQSLVARLKPRANPAA